MVASLRQKGALFIEYALILAFVVIVGVVFVSKDGIGESINTIFQTTEKVLTDASGSNLAAKAVVNKWHFWADNGEYRSDEKYMASLSEMITLEANTTYIVKFDSSKVDSSLLDDPSDLGKIGLMVYKYDAEGKYLGVVNNTEAQSLEKYSGEGYAYKIENETGYTYKLGVNLQTNAAWGTSDAVINDTNLAGFQKAIDSGLTITKNN